MHTGNYHALNSLLPVSVLLIYAFLRPNSTWRLLCKYAAPGSPSRKILVPPIHSLRPPSASYLSTYSLIAV